MNKNIVIAKARCSACFCEEYSEVYEVPIWEFGNGKCKYVVCKECGSLYRLEEPLNELEIYNDEYGALSGAELLDVFTESKSLACFC